MCMRQTKVPYVYLLHVALYSMQLPEHIMHAYVTPMQAVPEGSCNPQLQLHQFWSRCAMLLQDSQR